ncbi:substrate-binding domain-containing protein [Nesterenkonia sp. PF2B19]|uniref:substrate-binding domain-containing protein n=2 Tax=Nesterenkonia TaxID=57494 RepID=UPI002351BEEC|nr:substrate-binding domain-containing protein [Nesterenkonia sp. PF2B19]
MQRLLALSPELDGVFAASDLMAVSAVHALQAAGRRVPEDVAVVGFDDSSAAALCRPPLTTVLNPVAALATTAVDMLLRLMEGGEAQSVLIDTELVRRTSA